MIRNKKVAEGADRSHFLQASRISRKTSRRRLQSAIANAENNHGLDVDELIVAEAWVGKNLVHQTRSGLAGPRAFRPKILKPFSGGHHQGASSVRGAGLMGQKINPIGLRLQVNRTWDSRWYADGDEYGQSSARRPRKSVTTSTKNASSSRYSARVVIERPHRKCRVTIHAARPGVIIGKKGADIEQSCARKSLSEVHRQQSCT